MLQVSSGQSERKRCQISGQIGDATGARNRDDVLSLCQYPGQCQLRSRTAILFRQLFHLRDQVQIFREILTLKTRAVAAIVVCIKLFRAADGAG